MINYLLLKGLLSRCLKLLDLRWLLLLLLDDWLSGNDLLLNWWLDCKLLLQIVRKLIHNMLVLKLLLILQELLLVQMCHCGSLDLQLFNAL